MQTIALSLLAGNMAISENVWANSCDVVVDGLIACYPFDDDANDYSGNMNHGVLQSGVSFVEGKYGKAAKFDGGPEAYMRVENPLQKFSDQFTISAWVLTNGQGGSVFSKYSWDAMGGQGKGIVYWFAQEDYSDVFGTGGSTIRPIVLFNQTWQLEMSFPQYTAPIGKFEHLSVTYSSGKFKHYVNGTLMEEKTIQHLYSLDNPYDMLVGTYFNKDGTVLESHLLNSAFDGLIDELRIYNRSLSDVEIKQLAGIVEENGTYTAFGTLLGKTGKPLAGATIHLGEYTATTDKNGNWSISDLLAGDYPVVASKGNNADECGVAKILDNGQYQQQVDNCTVTYGDNNASVIAIWQVVNGNLQYVDKVTVEAFDAKFQEGRDYKIVDGAGEYVLEGIDDAGNTTSKVNVVRIQ